MHSEAPCILSQYPTSQWAHVPFKTVQPAYMDMYMYMYAGMKIEIASNIIRNNYSFMCKQAQYGHVLAVENLPTEPGAYM